MRARGRDAASFPRDGSKSTPSSPLPLPQLRDEFDRGVDVQLDEEHSIHDVAALLKEFLRDMPDPLLTKELYTAFINTTCRLSTPFLKELIIPIFRRFKFIPILTCLAVLDSDEQHSVTQLLVYLLPACNSDTLYRLLQFLSTVTDHAPDRLDKDGQEVSGKFMTNLQILSRYPSPPKRQKQC